MKIKDVATFSGIRDNQLIGYGLVVGLDGTGDRKDSKFTTASMANMLAAMGIAVDPIVLKPKNVAAVMVTASMPVSAKAGGKLDVTVSSIGDATSLAGGVLLLTPLKAPDGKVYALAQGTLITGGFSVSTGNVRLRENITTVGTIQNGATIERSVPFVFNNQEKLTLHLNTTSSNTAITIVNAINTLLQQDVAKAEDISTITVDIPSTYKGNAVPLVAQIENITIPQEESSKIIINERTGTVVISNNVQLQPVAIAHGNLQIVVTEEISVSQPKPFSDGKTVITSERNAEAIQQKEQLTLVKGANLQQLIDGLNALGVTPKDLISILQALQRSGSLVATLEII